ncbi:MAG: hypothetical protein M3247_08220 [Thermoproteota archaeon]|nr:hypothetical protein [Thermoproteota archaeon]
MLSVILSHDGQGLPNLPSKDDAHQKQKLHNKKYGLFEIQLRLVEPSYAIIIVAVDIVFELHLA